MWLSSSGSQHSRRVAARELHAAHIPSCVQASAQASNTWVLSEQQRVWNWYECRRTRFGRNWCEQRKRQRDSVVEMQASSERVSAAGGRGEWREAARGFQSKANTSNGHYALVLTERLGSQILREEKGSRGTELCRWATCRSPVESDKYWKTRVSVQEEQTTKEVTC